MSGGNRVIYDCSSSFLMTMAILNRFRVELEDESFILENERNNFSDKNGEC